MRISSLVPNNAADIRDASRESFGAIEDRRLRATVALVAGCIALAFALALVALAAASVWRRRRPAAAIAPAIATPGILEACARELARVRTAAAHDGWDRGLAERALTPLRVASAVALSHPFSQSFVDGAVTPRAGELLLRKGRWKPRQVLVSARVTADMIERRLAGREAPLPEGTDDLVRSLGESLRLFTAVRYGRSGHSDPVSLQRAVDDASTAIRRLRVAAFWPVRATRAAAHSASTWRNAAWNR
jgi:hypothetical protein